MRYIAAITGLVLCAWASGCVTEDRDNNIRADTMDLSNKTVLMVIAPSDFRDEELFVPKEFLEENGAKVVIASEKRGTANGMFGGVTSVDLPVSGITIGDYDAVVFVGGSGVESHRLYEDGAYLKLAADADGAEKIVGAICLGPMIPAGAGLLSKKNATVFSSGVAYVTDHGANYTGKAVTVDGRIVTAEGPHAAEEFARAIAEAISISDDAEHA
jgi:protease I